VRSRHLVWAVAAVPRFAFAAVAASVAIVRLAAATVALLATFAATVTLLATVSAAAVAAFVVAAAAFFRAVIRIIAPLSCHHKEVAQQETETQRCNYTPAAQGIACRSHPTHPWHLHCSQQVVKESYATPAIVQTAQRCIAADAASSEMPAAAHLFAPQKPPPSDPGDRIGPCCRELLSDLQA
jgi:hypothetical protein